MGWTGGDMTAKKKPPCATTGAEIKGENQDCGDHTPSRSPLQNRNRRRWLTSRRTALEVLLPYGRWDCSGYSVLFNRGYKALYRLNADGKVWPADPEQWHLWRRQFWFYGNVDAPWRNPETFERVKLV